MTGKWEDCPCCGAATFPDGSRQWDGAPVPCGCPCWVSIDEWDDGEPVGYVAFDAEPCPVCSVREAWVDGPDSEAARACRGEGFCGLSRLGAYALDEARKAMQWHAGGMRVARPPKLSRSAALDIADMAWRLGVGEDPHR